MKAMLVDGSFSHDALSQKTFDIARTQLGGRGLQVEELVLRDKNVNDCIGCFGCWVRTPGLCVFDDFGREYAKMEMFCDFIVAVTPITYGGYSSLFKRVMDRQIGVLLPYMKVRDNETHHPLRYRYFPKFLVIGTTDKPNDHVEKTFSQLVYRNGISANTSPDSIVIYGVNGENEAKERVSAFFTRMEVRS
jgi:multimeric flavodoxin WrbA